MTEKDMGYIDKAMLHMNCSNRRMLIALLSVCITFILTIVVFVFGYTIRERNWQSTLLTVTQNTEVNHGTESLPDP